MAESSTSLRWSADRQPRARQLLRLQGRADRDEQVARAEVATRDVTVDCVAPGFIASPMTDALNDKQKELSWRHSAAGAWGKGERIAAGRRFLASPEAGRRDRPDFACQRRNGNDLKYLRHRVAHAPF